jgi:hypothetical protein
MKRDQANLREILLKLGRAEKHLGDVLNALKGYKTGEIVLAMEKDEALQMAVQRVHLVPNSSPEISAIAGDFFSNVRAALDYVVWQLVLNNPPNEPGSSNLFPITDSPKGFGHQVARRRLRGVPEDALKIIEALQPYQDRSNPLGILNRLVNIDKHQTLNVVSVVADNTEVVSQSGTFALVLGDEELRDGSVFGEIGIPFNLIPSFFPDFESRLPSMKMRGTCSVFLAFDDPIAESLETFRVDRTLQSILTFTRDRVLPRFDDFLRP